jgi:hypothetical protein
MALNFGAIDNALSRRTAAQSQGFKQIDNRLSNLVNPPPAVPHPQPAAPVQEKPPAFTPINYGALDAQGNAELNTANTGHQNAYNNADTVYNQGEAENKAQHLAAEQAYADAQRGTLNNAAARGALHSGILAYNQYRDTAGFDKVAGKGGSLARALTTLATNRQIAKQNADQTWSNAQNTILGNANQRLNAAAQARYQQLYGGA